jgi:hypothetical protein
MPQPQQPPEPRPQRDNPRPPQPHQPPPDRVKDIPEHVEPDKPWPR